MAEVRRRPGKQLEVYDANDEPACGTRRDLP